MREIVCLLDLDGVVYDFMGQCCKAWNTTEAEVKARMPHGEYDIEPYLTGLPKPGCTDAFWARIDPLGEAFWSDGDALPWAHELYDGLLSRGEVVFLTSPSFDPASYSGKAKFVQKFTEDKKSRNILVGKPKHLCAAPNHVLIDDYDKNIEKFKDNGGQAILFPRWWNSKHGFKGDKCQSVLSQYDKIAESLACSQGTNSSGGWRS